MPKDVSDTNSVPRRGNRGSETGEPRIGYLKQGLGIRRFLHRGLAKVSTEWGLLCTVVNVGILLCGMGRKSGRSCDDRRPGGAAGS